MITQSLRPMGNIRAAQRPTFGNSITVNPDAIRAKLLTKLEPLVDKAVERAEEQLTTGNSRYEPEARGAAMVLNTITSLLSHYPPHCNTARDFSP